VLHPEHKSGRSFDAAGQQLFRVTCSSLNEAWYPVIEWRDLDPAEGWVDHGGWSQRA
jgi:hypothetical protein